MGKGCLGASYLSWESRALGLSRLFPPQWRTEQTLASDCLGWRESQASENQQTQASVAFCLAAATFFTDSTQETGRELSPGVLSCTSLQEAACPRHQRSGAGSGQVQAPS